MTERHLRPEVGAALADPWMHLCLLRSLEQEDLLRQIDRLYGTTLVTSAIDAIEKIVDQASGKAADDMRLFTEFVYDYVYTRVPRPEGFEAKLKDILDEGEE